MLRKREVDACNRYDSHSGIIILIFIKMFHIKWRYYFAYKVNPQTWTYKYWVKKIINLKSNKIYWINPFTMLFATLNLDRAKEGLMFLY